MKVCPICRTEYDASQLFCHNDGSALDNNVADSETIVYSRPGTPVQQPTIVFSPPVTQSSVPQKRSIGLLIGVIVGGFFLGLLVVGAAGAFFYFSGRQNENNAGVNTANSTKSPTPDEEKEKIKDQLANLQKQIEQQKNQKPANIPPPVNPAPPPSSGATTAFANSPADGFLALRSEPSSETGSRVTKIPHGAQIAIGRCGQYITTARGNYGRWCTAAYNGFSGWVFDAFVRY